MAEKSLARKGLVEMITHDGNNRTQVFSVSRETIFSGLAGGR